MSEEQLVSTLLREVRIKGTLLCWSTNECSVPLTANAKFPEGTASGAYKAAVAAHPNYDIVRVDSQRINWTLKELDVSINGINESLQLWFVFTQRYSSAFAFGLIEAGFAPGDKLMLYCD